MLERKEVELDRGMLVEQNLGQERELPERR